MLSSSQNLKVLVWLNLVVQQVFVIILPRTCIWCQLRAAAICCLSVHIIRRLLLLQISHNRSLDGVLDLLNSKNMTEAGPVDLIDDEGDDADDVLLPPPEGVGPQSHCWSSLLPCTTSCRSLQQGCNGMSWLASCTFSVLCSCILLQGNHGLLGLSAHATAAVLS